MTDIIWASIVSIIFLLLFVIAEIAHHKGVQTEVTRKFVHFGGAFVTIFFPFILMLPCLENSIESRYTHFSASHFKLILSKFVLVPAKISFSSSFCAYHDFD